MTARLEDYKGLACVRLDAESLTFDLFSLRPDAPVLRVREKQSETGEVQVIDCLSDPQRRISRGERIPGAALEVWGPLDNRRWLVPLAHWHGGAVLRACNELQEYAKAAYADGGATRGTEQ